MKITTINSIETSSLCDNSCEYCCSPEQHKYRETGLMTLEIFEKALEWVTHYVLKGTQLELNLFGVGEPTLNKDIVEMVHRARCAMPAKLMVHLNTNGNKMTLELARALKRAGVSDIDITGHNPRATAKTIKIFKEVGIDGQLSIDFMTSPNNWAGQVDWFEPDYEYPCPWLHRGQVMIMSNGDVTRCCLDAFAKGVMGNVLTDDLSEMELTPFEVCDKCHQTVPDSMVSKIEIVKG